MGLLDGNAVVSIKRYRSSVFAPSIESRPEFGDAASLAPTTVKQL